MAKLVIVSLATNDPDNGNETDRVTAVQLYDDALDLQWGEWPQSSAPRWSIKNGRLKISRRKFAVKSTKDWYGNWCWTGVWMEAEEAVKLLNYLSQDDRWHCEGGYCDLCDAYAAHAVTADLLAEVMA